MHVGAVKAPTIRRSKTCKRSRQSVSTSQSRFFKSTVLTRQLMYSFAASSSAATAIVRAVARVVPLRAADPRPNDDTRKPDCLAEAAGFGIRSAGVGHRLRLSLAMRCGTTTFNRDAHVLLLPLRAGVWANSDSETQRFESSRLSQPRCLRLPSLIEL
jgi:hypothetical protein